MSDKYVFLDFPIEEYFKIHKYSGNKLNTVLLTCEDKMKKNFYEVKLLNKLHPVLSVFGTRTPLTFLLFTLLPTSTSLLPFDHKL